MNVASLELCKELYEVSGWDDCPSYYNDMGGGNLDLVFGQRPKRIGSKKFSGTWWPAYDLGYLLRKLPKRISVGQHRAALEFCTIADTDNSPWYMQYVGAGSPKHYQCADTPEDAAAKLAIQLFKEGVLK